MTELFLTGPGSHSGETSCYPRMLLPQLLSKSHFPLKFMLEDGEIKRQKPPDSQGSSWENNEQTPLPVRHARITSTETVEGYETQKKPIETSKRMICKGQESEEASNSPKDRRSPPAVLIRLAH